jgi:molybdate transport system regulatory protein
MRVRTRVWLERGGVDVFGGGRHHLLEAVRRTGSLNRAAADLGMSYRAAWRKVRECEERLGIPLLAGTIGGAGGGGSRLTPEGERLVAGYEKFERALAASARRLARAHLGFLGDEAGDPAEGKRKDE